VALQCALVPMIRMAPLDLFTHALIVLACRAPATPAVSPAMTNTAREASAIFTNLVSTSLP
jgi:hypothetical protein